MFASRATKLINSDQLGSTLQAFGRSDFGAAVAKWCDLLVEVRPEVLEKLARAMAEARGVKLPPKLTVYDGEREKTSLENWKMTQCAVSRRDSVCRPVAD